MVTAKSFEASPGIGGKGGTISGSIAAGILKNENGQPLHPYMDECDVYNRMIHGWNVPDNPAMRRGRVFEPWIRSVSEGVIGHTIVEPWSKTVTHKDDPRFSGSVDGYVLSTDGNRIGIAEFKSASRRGRNWTGPSPAHYVIQLEQYKWIEGMDLGWLICLEADDDIFEDAEAEIIERCGLSVSRDTIEELNRNPEVVEVAVGVITRRMASGSMVLHVREHHGDPSFYEQAYVPTLREWYERHIETGTPPELTGSDGARQIAMRSNPDRSGELSILAPGERLEPIGVDQREISDSMDILREIAIIDQQSAEIKRLESDNSARKNRLIQLLGQFESATLRSGRKIAAKAKMTTTTRKGSIDVGALLKDNPEYLDTYRSLDLKALTAKEPAVVEKYRRPPSVSQSMRITFNADEFESVSGINPDSLGGE